MPVYVLHHVPVLALGVLILPMGWPAPLAALAIWTAATAVSLGAYRLLVQPWSLPRRLVGMDAHRVLRVLRAGGPQAPA